MIFVQFDAGGTELCVDLDDGGEYQPRLIFAGDDIEALCAQFQHTGVEIIAGGPASHGSWSATRTAMRSSSRPSLRPFPMWR